MHVIHLKCESINILGILLQNCTETFDVMRDHKSLSETGRLKFINVTKGRTAVKSSLLFNIDWFSPKNKQLTFDIFLYTSLYTALLV